jgi:hypothetical protein
VHGLNWVDAVSTKSCHHEAHEGHEGLGNMYIKPPNFVRWNAIPRTTTAALPNINSTYFIRFHIQIRSITEAAIREQDRSRYRIVIFRRGILRCQNIITTKTI